MWAFDVEGGYQWAGLPLKPWLRGGYFLGSGDDNAADARHETFFQVLPTVRLYAKFPFFNLMNLSDAFAQLIVTPSQAIRVGIDFHHLSLAEAGDLFYAGAGASSRFGSGRRYQCHSGLGSGRPVARQASGFFRNPRSHQCGR